MTDARVGVSIAITCDFSMLAKLTNVLRDLDAMGVAYSVTLESEGWSQTYENSKAWWDASRSPMFDPQVNDK